jgi:hypothetical protein
MLGRSGVGVIMMLSIFSAIYMQDSPHLPLPTQQKFLKHPFGAEPTCVNANDRLHVI